MIYVVMVSDRHKDPEPYLFSDRGEAIGFAYTEALGIAGGNESRIEESEVEGRELLLQIEPEGDSVWVLGKEIR